ncbi:MAG: hypothetical protein JKY99_08540, partial [Rhizobiales bacterium]|nr:hypothetical protein [Hyphomicrobiales bacterium]
GTLGHRHGQRHCKAAQNVSPKGKTPLSEAVRQAAELLKYTEEKATVILITDGIETCNLDPCALGSALEKLGVDFTAHVVGFGLSREEGRQVACLAENTGGLYIDAQNSGELVDALNQTVVVEAPTVEEPTPEAVEELPDASLNAPEESTIAQRVVVAWEGPGGRYDRIELFNPAARNGEGKVVRSKAVNINDEPFVHLVVPAEPGVYQFRYFNAKNRTVLVTRDITVVAADVALFAPDEIGIGRTLKVEWIGPGGRFDAIHIIAEGASKAVRKKSLSGKGFDERKVELPAPGKAGAYELQYWNGDNKRMLASRPITIVEAPVSLEAAETAETSKAFTVDWIGPGARYDAVQLWDPAARGGEGKKLRKKRLRNDDFDNQRITMAGPANPGIYELRYWNGDNKIVLATRKIEFTASVISLDAPDTIGQGRTVTINWQGPGAYYDTIHIWDPNARGGEGKKLKEKRLRYDDFDNNKASLPVPVKPGIYELRYWNGDNKKVLLTRPITVTAMPLSVSGPASVAAGEVFTVSWEGPAAYYDEIHLIDPKARGGEGKKLVKKRVRSGDWDNKKVTMKAPKSGGNFVLRYWNGDYKSVLAESPITVK